MISGDSFGTLTYNDNGNTLASKVAASLTIFFVFVCLIWPATIFRAIQLLRKPSR